MFNELWETVRRSGTGSDAEIHVSGTGASGIGD